MFWDRTGFGRLVVRRKADIKLKLGGAEIAECKVPSQLGYASRVCFAVTKCQQFDRCGAIFLLTEYRHK